MYGTGYLVVTVSYYIERSGFGHALIALLILNKSFFHSGKELNENGFLTKICRALCGFFSVAIWQIEPFLEK
jgi:hypothetical protein